MARTLVFAFVALCMLAVTHDVPKGKAITILGGHPKTGQSGSAQNRPVVGC